MANLTAITGNWHQTAGLNTSFGGVATTAADNVTIPNGVTVTIVSGVVALCRSLTVENGATLIFGNSTSTLNIGDATLGTGNVALSIGSTATMTYTSGTPSIQFLSTNSTAQTITTNGKTLPNVTFNGVGGKWQLQDALTCSGNLTVTAGGFFGNGQTITAAQFTGGTSGVRTVDITNCSITLTTGGGTPWNFGFTPTNLTFVSTGSTITFTGSLSLEFRGGALTYNNFVNTMTTGTAPIQMSAANTFNNLTFTGAAGTACSVMLAANQTVTGTLTITGNSATNRVLCYSDTLGTPRVITAAATSLTDVDFMDISIVGPTGSTITSDSFNRADGALGSTDAAAGGSALAWTASSGTWVIDTNKAACTTAAAGYRDVTVDVGVTDMAVEAVITPGVEIWGLTARFTDQNNRIWVQQGGASPPVVVQIAAGSQNIIFTASAAISAGDRCRLVVAGNNVVLYKNDTSIGAGVITKTLTGTRAGLTAYAYNADPARRFDDFIVKAVPGVTGTRLGDCLGNSGIEFTTASGTARDGGGAGVKRYAVAAGNWSSTATWSESDGGAPGASVPLPQDDVYIKRSFSSETITIDMPRLCRLLDFTGSTGTLHTSQLVTTATIFGSLVLANIPGNLLASNIRLLGKSNTITTNSRTFINANASLVIDGSYTMTDQLFVGGDLSSIYGSLNTGSYAISCGRFMFSYSGTLNLGSSSITITQTGAATPAWTVSSLVNLSAASSTITFALDAPIGGATSSAAATHTFAGGDKSYGTLTYTVADSPGALTITGSNTFGTVNIGSGRSLKLTSGTTQKIGTLNVNGVPRGGVSLPGISTHFLSTPDSAAVSVTGDIDIRVRVAMSSWAATNRIILGKWSQSLGGSYVLSMGETANRLALNIYGSGGTYSPSTANVPFSAGQAGWIRATYRASDGRIQFFTATDSPAMPSIWTQLGTDLSTTQTYITDTTAPLEIGSINGGFSGGGTGTTNGEGVFYRAQIRNNVLDDGTGIVFDTDFSNQFGPHFLDSVNGAIITPSTTLANVGDGRVVIESSTAGTGATLEVGSVTGMNYVDLKDVVMNGADTYIGATSVIRSNVKGVRRGPQTGMSMMMGV